MFFKGQECSRDCSGHMAGYDWAEERGISKEEGCRGNSQSFIDGCLLYVAERLDELRGGDEVDDDPRQSCTPGRYGDC